MKDHGQPIPRGTLQRWSSDLHADRYAQVREDVMPRLKAMMAEEHTALARQQMSVANKLLARLEAEADELPVRDLPGAIRNIDVGSGIHTDKARDLRGDPSMIVRKETRDVRELLEEIHRKFPGIVHVNQALIEGTAEEDTDA